MDQPRKDVIRTIKEGTFTFKKLELARCFQEKTDMRVVEAFEIKDPSVRKAIKIYNDFRDRSDHSKARILAEIVCMNTMCHPNIIKLEAAIYSRLDKTLCLITPLYSRGTLLDVLKRPALDIDTTWTYFIEIGCALRYLHSRHVIHGDVKPANVFISESGSAILADFDQARSLGDQKKVHSWTGSRNFIGPEYREGRPTDPYLMDAYALGTTLFAMHFFHSGPVKYNCDYEYQSSILLKKDTEQQSKTYHLLLAMNRLVRRDPARRKSVTRVFKEVQHPDMKAVINSL